MEKFKEIWFKTDQVRSSQISWFQASAPLIKSYLLVHLHQVTLLMSDLLLRQIMSSFELNASEFGPLRRFSAVSSRRS